MNASWEGRVFPSRPKKSSNFWFDCALAMGAVHNPLVVLKNFTVESNCVKAIIITNCVEPDGFQDMIGSLVACVNYSTCPK